MALALGTCGPGENARSSPRCCSHRHAPRSGVLRQEAGVGRVKAWFRLRSMTRSDSGRLPIPLMIPPPRGLRGASRKPARKRCYGENPPVRCERRQWNAGFHLIPVQRGLLLRRIDFRCVARMTLNPHLASRGSKESAAVCFIRCVNLKAIMHARIEVKSAEEPPASESPSVEVRSAQPGRYPQSVR